MFKFAEGFKIIFDEWNPYFKGPTYIASVKVVLSLCIKDVEFKFHLDQC